MKQLDPEVEIGLIVPFIPEDPVELMKSMDAMVYLTYIYNITPDMIDGLKVHGYYVLSLIHISSLRSVSPERRCFLTSLMPRRGCRPRIWNGRRS